MSLSFGPVAGDAQSAIPLPVVFPRRYPYLMEQGQNLGIAEVRVRITAPITGTGPKIQGKQGATTVVAETELMSIGANVYRAENLEVVTAFTANKTAFHEGYQIDWYVSRDGSTWEFAGTSVNPIYVCLRDPNEIRISVFRTVVHLACSKPGATDEASAAAKTWELFSNDVTGPENVETWDKRPLHYYRFRSRIAETPISVVGLLLTGNGNCVAWHLLLYYAWSVNGVASDHIFVRCKLDSGFTSMFVNEWNFLGSTFYFESTAFDMIPWPENDTNPYGFYDDGVGLEFENRRTLKGQNSGGDAPSQKVFQNHQFRLYDGEYYDPSYGVKYAGESDFQTVALAGYGVAAGPRALAFSARSSAIVIEFLVNPMI